MSCRPTSPVYYQSDTKCSSQDCACTKMRECLRSSEFPAGGHLKWCLRLNLKDRDKCFDIRLILLKANLANTRAEVKFCFLNSKGEKKYWLESQTSQYFVCGTEDGSSHRFTKDVLLKNNLISGDKLTIFAEVNVIADKTNKTSQIYSVAHFKEPECKLIENFGNILDKEKFYDVILAVNGQELRAHKAILAARSSIFAAMFEHEIQENDINIVNITDIKFNALKEMLNFIYTGKAPNIDQMARDLLAAANKYDLAKLKSMCELALYRTLTPETAAEILILADLYAAKQLKMQTINFIRVYASNVEKTQGWQNLIKEHRKLISEVGLKK